MLFLEVNIYPPTPSSATRRRRLNAMLRIGAGRYSAKNAETHLFAALFTVSCVPCCFALPNKTRWAQNIGFCHFIAKMHFTGYKTYYGRRQAFLAWVIIWRASGRETHGSQSESSAHAKIWPRRRPKSQTRHVELINFLKFSAFFAEFVILRTILQRKWRLKRKISRSLQREIRLKRSIYPRNPRGQWTVSSNFRTSPKWTMSW